MTRPIQRRILVGFVFALLFLIINAAISYQATTTLIENQQNVDHTLEVIAELETTLSELKDAETGQRGYIITGQEDFLEPYNSSIYTIDDHIARLKELTSDNPTQQSLLPAIEEKSKTRLSYLERGIALQKQGRTQEAREWIAGRLGKRVMDDLQSLLEEMKNVERSLLNQRKAEADLSGRRVRLTFSIASFLAIALVSLTYYLISRDIRVRERAAEELQAAHDTLEIRVRERTAELAETNEALGIEIAERLRAEEKMKEFTVELERSNRELQDFAFVASHDLQEPLRKIQAFGDRLKTKYGSSFNDEGRDYLERMQNAARRMHTLINDLLTFSRITTKSQQFVPVNLDQIARDVLNDLETRVHQTGGRVEIDSLPAIEADPLQMRQLMQNLIGNALKFHRKDEPPVVRVRGELAQDDAKDDGEVSDNGFCRIIVSDNGIGFDEKYLDRIFTPFQRLHSGSEYEGTGMGLAVCRKIVERHGGSLTARSEPGQGATFLITLPITHRKGEGL